MNFLKQKWLSCLVALVAVAVLIVLIVQAANQNHLAHQNHHAVAVVAVQLQLLLQQAEQCSNAFLPGPQVLAKQLNAT